VKFLSELVSLRRGGWSTSVGTLLVGGLLIMVPARAQAPATAEIPTQIPGHDAILLGTDWYPEQWPEARWEEDLRLMEAAHIKVVRIAEFAWSAMEPTEGRYNFDWLERAVDLAGKYGIASVLGTPTAAPPAWLTSKYPDTLRIEENGRRATHGNRQQGSFSSPLYREFCRKITEQMATHFAHNPNVIGWQIDNEYSELSYDADTRTQFQNWLKGKYKALDNLNSHWTTAYWSQTYDNWNEIPIPIGGHNPGLMLEWKRFVSDTWKDYQQNQIDAIRKHVDPRQFITTNFMGFFDGFDHYVVAGPLTFAAWDDYVGTGHVDPAYNGLRHDLTRGFKQRNFWVIETQPGAVNWAPVNNFLNKGEVRAMAWQAIGHGADEVGYWQWRSASNGQEQYHGTLVGPDGTPVPLYQEIADLGGEFTKAQDSLKGTQTSSEVALLHSYDSRWAIDFQKHNTDYKQIDILESYYRGLQKLAQSVDVINPYAPLKSYKLVVAPDLNLIPQDLAEHLLEYVRGGGHLVLGPRSGMKDEFNSLLPQRQPGFLVEPLGGRVEQYYALEKDFPVSGTWGNGETKAWAEQLKQSAPDAEVLMRYGKSNGWLDDQLAAVTRAVGKGRITYIGAVLDDKLMDAATNWMIAKSGVVAALGPVPDGVEVCRRKGARSQVFVVINFGLEAQRVTLPRSMHAVLANKDEKELELTRYGVEVLLDRTP